MKKLKIKLVSIWFAIASKFSEMFGVIPPTKIGEPTSQRLLSYQIALSKVFDPATEYTPGEWFASPERAELIKWFPEIASVAQEMLLEDHEERSAK